MATTTIILIDAETSEPVENKRVNLEFAWGGFTPNIWTDYDGEAVIDHASTGEARLYINGNYVKNIMSGRVIKIYGRRR